MDGGDGDGDDARLGLHGGDLELARVAVAGAEIDGHGECECVV